MVAHAPSIGRRRYYPFGPLGKPSSGALRFRSAQLGVRRLLRQRIGKYALLPRSKLACRERRESKSDVPRHYSLNAATLGIDDVPPIDGHRVAVVIVLKGSRAWALPPELRVETEMPRRYSAHQRDVIGYGWVIREVPGAILRSAQSDRLTFRRCSSAKFSERPRDPQGDRRTSPPCLTFPQRN